MSKPMTKRGKMFLFLLFKTRLECLNRERCLLCGHSLLAFSLSLSLSLSLSRLAKELPVVRELKRQSIESIDEIFGHSRIRPHSDSNRWTHSNEPLGN